MRYNCGFIPDHLPELTLAEEIMFAAPGLLARQAPSAETKVHVINWITSPPGLVQKLLPLLSKLGILITTSYVICVSGQAMGALP